MAQGKIKLQANDGKVAGIVFEDGAATDVSVTVPKEGGELLVTEGAQTKNGVLTFTDSPIVPVPTTVNQAIGMGSIIEKTGASIGYGVGSGSTVTQLTDKSTTVTLNKPSGQIVSASGAVAGGGSVSFTVLNSTVTVTDTVLVVLSAAGAVSDLTAYDLSAVWVGNGSFYIKIKNTTGASKSESLTIQFVVIKGAIA